MLSQHNIAYILRRKLSIPSLIYISTLHHIRYITLHHYRKEKEVLYKNWFACHEQIDQKNIDQSLDYSH